MSCITRCVMRWGLISGLALGGLTLLVGPERVAAGLAQIRTKAQTVVDNVVEDPVALRRQLEQLAEDYPEKIAEVQGEMASVDRQLELIERDVEIAARVVANTAEDLTVLKSKIARAEEALETRYTDSGAAPKVFVRFDGVRFTIDEAYREVLRIGTIRTTFQDRLAIEQEQHVMLQEQKARLGEIRDKLEEEFNTYQAQLWALDRQIDAIERNERLIELMEDQKQTLASYDRFERVGNLHQIQAKLAELKTIQDAQIETLRKSNFRSDYEQRARMELEEAEVDTDAIFEELFEEAEEADKPEAKTSKNSVAWAPPIIID